MPITKVDRAAWIAKHANALPERLRVTLPQTDDEEELRVALNQMLDGLHRASLHYSESIDAPFQADRDRRKAKLRSRR